MRLHLRYITAVQNVCALLTEDQANNITALALALGKFSQAKPGTIQVTKTGLYLTCYPAVNDSSKHKERL